ncbi:MAG: hypothetical protein ACJ8J7_04895 [Sulfurifustaceae bacterium]
MPDMLTAAAIFGFLGAMFFLMASAALKRGRLLRLTTRLTLSVVFLAVAALLGAITLGTQGYRALTHEEVAALVETEPLGPHHFRARFSFPDGRSASYVLAGDELYVDAHILKWKPLVNLLGLHTAYELDRVGGRYRLLSDEQRAPRTVYGVAPARTINLFNLRQRYAMLAPLLDAEYGSATFVSVEQAQRLEVRVSTSGLLIRPLGAVTGSLAASQ